LLIVSNNLPFDIRFSRNKPLIAEKTGGITTGLNAFYNYLHCRWIGWSGNENIEFGEDQQKKISRLYAGKNCHPVELDEEEILNHYHGFCNQTLWPLFHYFTQYSVFNDDWWESYRQVNMKFAEKVLSIAEKGDKIWIHDYQLMLVPALIREANPDLSIGFFMHIPFPSFEIFRILPWRRELVEGILGADLVAFHSFDYERHFMSCVRRILGHDNILNTVRINERVIKIDNFPMGIDFENVRYQASRHIYRGKKREDKRIRAPFRVQERRKR
jgi:trehalose 6-phosphate synthase/phosphatase